MDGWLGHCPLKIVYSMIFGVYNEQDESVHNIMRNNETNITLRRTFGEEEHEERQQLNSQIKYTFEH